MRIRSLTLGLSLCLASLMAACGSPTITIGPNSLNSRYTDEQPVLSANGRFVAFVSNRNGSRDVWMYDLQQRQFVDLPGLNRPDAIASSPSVSNTARYITYLTQIQGRSAIVLYDRILRQPQVLYQPYQGPIRHPRISPDGRYIVFETGMRGQWDVGAIDRGINIELDLLDGVAPSSEF